MPVPVDISLLGSLLVHRDDRSVRIPEGKQRIILATLALNAGHPVSVDTLIDHLWGNRPPTAARTTVRGHVKRLRKWLDGDQDSSLITSGRLTYTLAVEPGQVDFWRFRRLLDLATVHRGGPEEHRLLCQAIELWRGGPLSDVHSDSLRAQTVESAWEDYLFALHRRIELELHHGAADRVVAELMRLVTEHPLREPFWLQLLTALRESCRVAEALAAYERCRRILADELGAIPGAALLNFHRELLSATPVPQC
ncbi:hypothetical protein D5S17_11530 [Pseudonocardiaceae bacterium YIM PH 21723]|nr:hypothetical protein D5S17_11530 [Pseudonocardiaceae bacterium YIM PH 21723]